MTEVLSTESVKAFWDGQAISRGIDPSATSPDVHYRELEISRILPHLWDYGTVCDVGCGNGFSTLRFAEQNPNAKFFGIDYSEQMINAAIDAHQKVPHKNVKFLQADVRRLTELGMKFDTIITERCLINLTSFAEQKEALLEIRHSLRSGGKAVLVENTIEGLANLNNMRGRLGLSKIAMRWHNQYLPQTEFLQFARKYFTVQTVDNIGNLYYLLSRVVYAKMAEMDGVEPSYDHPINQIAAQLPSLPAYSWSPNFLFVMKAMD